jgi:RNA polymerase sigma-70 factor (ECF subfamily)
MTTAPDDFARRLVRARADPGDARGRLLESFRGYLLMIAGEEIDPALRAKGGASDLVQETFLEAHRDFDQFRGTDEAELLAWLRRLLLNNVANFARRYRGTEKRQVDREVPLGADESAGGGAPLPADGPTPSWVVAQHEQAENLGRALARLPDDYRTVLLLRHQEGLSFPEIAERMGRTPNAVHKLWARAVERLEQELANPP